MRFFEDEFRRLGEPKAPEEEPERLMAYVVCVNPRCGYNEGFADLRDSPIACPRCSRELVRDCGTCHMILRSPLPICSNCGRPIALGRAVPPPEPTTIP